MTDTKVDEVRADGLSLFDEILTITAEREVILITVVGLRAVETEIEVTGHDGTSFTTAMDATFHRVAAV